MIINCVKITHNLERYLQKFIFQQKLIIKTYIINQFSTMQKEEDKDNKQAEEKQQQRDKMLFKKLEQTMLVLKKDPRLYIQEIRHYIKLFKEEFVKLTENTQKKNERFGELTIFLCRCSTYYASDMKFISEYLIDLLNNYANILHSYNRRKAAAGIMILRSKNILFPVSTLQFLFGLLGVLDKELRKMVYSFIVNDIRRMNKHHKNNSINKQLQNFIFEYIKKNSDKVARKMINLMIDLYKKNIWNDHKVVNIIANGCFSSSYKIRLISSYFLISTTQPKQAEDSDQDDGPTDPGQIKAKKGITKMTKNKEKMIQKQKKRAQRKLKRREDSMKIVHFFPIDQIYNPQDFSEKLFSVMVKKQEKFLVKIVLMSLLARMIGRHKLIILPFYSHLQKYMSPHQKEVGKILAYFAQSIHSLIPQQELEPIIKHIIQNFVNDRCSQMAMTMGLNVLREVVNKSPFILNNEMMMYLCTYYQFKNKNVAGAAKSLINVVRQVNPDILEKKYRGRNIKENPESTNKNEVVHDKIDGAQLLDENALIPVYMDRILTDDDFRRIKLLKKKKQKELEDAQMEEDQDQDQEQEQQQVDIGSSDEEGENNQEGLEDADEWETVKEDQQQNDGQEENQESQLDWGDAEQIEGDQDEEEQEQSDKEQQQSKKISNKLKANNRKRRTELSELESELDLDDDEQEDDNPHGFINLDRITFYKKNKGEVKSEKKAMLESEGKKKFAHTPKQKGGGTNDKQKLKSKPIMMVRPKKNKLKLREKQVKIRIKDLKNKLGKVSSGKEAKKMKMKKVKK